MTQFLRNDKARAAQIFSFLSDLTKIEDLHLNLTNIPLSKASLSVISKGISSQINLRNLNLVLQNCHVSDLDLSLLAFEIQKKKTIQSLSINLAKNPEIVSTGLIELLGAIK